MKFIDLFAGVGGFRRGMELAGHECVGFCEWDRFATASYTSMHLIREEQRDYLATLDLKKRQKEILKDEYRNGEWYANDIRNVDARSVPRVDCWCFGAPCQDFSVAGKRAGLDGDRSALVREVFRILGEMRGENRPEWIIYENVKGMLSSNRGFDFLEILLAMDELGYDVEWQIFNSKDWGVPQNRERVYTVGHLRRNGAAKIFPITGAGGENNISVIANRRSKYKKNGRIYDIGGISPGLNGIGSGGNNEPKVALPCFVDMNYGAGIKQTETARSIQSRYYKGICGREREVSGVAIPVLTPDRVQKRQNGRRFKEDGEPMFTLTGQDRHGVGVSVHGSTVSATDDKTENGIYIKISDELTVYAVWYEKYGCYIAIRRLTPRECFRLQGWEDIYFDRAEFVNSDSQLYKQAGNGVTVPVVKIIGEAIARLERKITNEKKF